MRFVRESSATARSLALVCAVVAAAGATLSIGLALARQIPADVPPVLMFWNGGLVLLLGAVAAGCHPATAHWSVGRRYGAGGLLLAGSFLSACAWSADGWSLLALSVAWVALGVPTITLWALQTAGTTRPSVLESDVPRPANASDSETHGGPTPPLGVESTECPEESVPPGDEVMIQQFTRRRSSHGETLAVEWRIRFAPGQLHQSLQLPISPPFSAPPAVECEPIAGDDVELTVGVVHPYGVRIEARRASGGAQAAECVIGLVLSAPTPAAAA